MSIPSSKNSFGTQFKAHIVANRAARHLRLKALEKEQNKTKKSQGVLPGTVCIVLYIDILNLVLVYTSIYSTIMSTTRVHQNKYTTVVSTAVYTSILLSISRYSTNYSCTIMYQYSSSWNIDT